MKKIFVLLFSIFLVQCSSINQSTPPESVKSFVQMILKDPNKLLNLKENFPELIIDSLLDCEMKDKVNINDMIKFINLEFNDENMIDMFKWISNPVGIKSVVTVCPPVLNAALNKKLFVYGISKDEAGITLYWIKERNRYVLYHIYCGYVAPRGKPL